MTLSVRPLGVNQDSGPGPHRASAFSITLRWFPGHEATPNWIEVFNPRVAFSAFNEEAERFAAKYRIVPGAGSDSHVAQGLGSVRIRVHDFDGPEEFLEAMRDADIARKHKNLVYVQALKRIQTTGGRAGARRPPSQKPKPAKGGTRRADKRAAAVGARARRGSRRAS